MTGTKEIKLVASLRLKKYRDELGLFCVEGEKMVAEALSSGLEVVHVFRSEEVGQAAMARMSSLSTPPPVLAVLRKPSDLPPEPGGLCLALDAVRDPGNLGTILRTADWFGVDCIYASRDTVELYNPKVIQATMGTIFRKRVIYCELTELCRSFSKASLQVSGTFLGGEDIYSATLPGEGLIVLGNEARGISPEVAALVDRKFTIPPLAPGMGPESLNVSVACAITLSEFRRRNHIL